MTAPLGPEAAIDVLARTIWGEARGEDVAGMAAVANVVLNRAAEPERFGASIEAVCHAPWQFSCWNRNDPNLAKLLAVTAADARFAAALRLARRALAGALDDATFGSTHYHARGIFPRWARGCAPAAEIGRHVFYNDVE